MTGAKGKLAGCFAVLLMTALLLVPAVHAAQNDDDSDDGEGRQWRISLGGIVSFAWWTSTWQKFDGIFNAVPTSMITSFKYTINPAFMYGPLAAITFNPRWSISGSFMYAQFQAEGKAISSFPLFNSAPFMTKYKKTTVKMDADFLANVNFSKYVKFFFGPKYQGYSYTDKYNFFKSNIVYHSVAFGLGFGGIIPIVGDLFILPNVSALGTVGWQKTSGVDFSTLLKSSSSAKLPTNTFGVGVNGSVAFAYVISPAKLTLSLGYRAQYIYFTKKLSAYNGNKYDLFHYPFFSVVFTF